MKTLDIPFAHTTKEYDLEYGSRYESHHYSFGYSFTSNLVFQPKVADTLMVATTAATPWLAHVYSKVRNWAVWMIDSPACNYVVSVCGEGRAHISVRLTAWQPNRLVFCSKLSTLFTIIELLWIFISNSKYVKNIHNKLKRFFLCSKNLRLQFEFNWNSLKYEVCLHICLCPM